MKRFIMLAAIGLTLFSCQQPKHYISINGFAQGTTYSITYQADSNFNYQREIDSLLADFDTSCSIYNANSIVSRINSNDTTVRADKHFTAVFNLSRMVWEKSNGAFDITIGPLAEAWGFGFKNKVKLDSAMVDSLKALVGMEKIRLENGSLIKADPRMFINLNAVAQGYSSDVVAEFLESKQIMNYMVEIGGEIRTNGLNSKGKEWVIGVDKPVDNAIPGETFQFLLALSGKSVATSGNYRKFYEENGVKYAHTIDPKSGFPVRHTLLCATVIADDCGTADAFATAFMVVGIDKARDMISTLKGVDAIFVYTDAQGVYKTLATEGAKKFIIEED
ncbi:FAD:protein FMN transferase [Williamwhitmania taraxaci]|uniref:FAD:protein FMN transferase n=1 Tax=Williamwhitmania taraxaci TaxID=1640674 RepID=A0A1G6KCQ4_9BACT|nr:FAD:protein FMN transferase [Williamwhitmania taraxaci]SDC28707.1 thiamine biosynthesis lipoprotein [Williamwhitmania taraxaci]